MPERVAVVGAGIAGLAQAWREAVRGAEVTLYERSPKAEGASVRNFGMVWPIGQRADLLETALLSRSLWDEVVREAGVWASPSGSLYVATRDDEWRVLSEFADAAPALGYRVELLSPAQTLERCPAAGVEGLRGGLYSATELGVDPREVIATMPGWLSERFGVRLRFATAVTQVDTGRVITGDGDLDEFDRITIASGADFRTLFPEAFAEHCLASCKLQMMRTGPQPDGWRLGPMIASGLTLRHYASFEVCEGITDLKRRIAEETPELDRYGIHVMAAQNGIGEVVLGDSHEYGQDITPFDKEEITQLMQRELHKILDLPSWDLAATWHGVYAIQPGSDGVQFIHEPVEGVTIIIPTGGCGMTMSFGLAEQRAQRRDAGSPAVAGVAE